LLKLQSSSGVYWQPSPESHACAAQHYAGRAANPKTKAKREPMNAYRSKVLGISFVLVASPGCVQLSSAPVSPAPLAASLLQGAPRRSLGPAPNQWGRSDLGIFESDNWSGYAVVGTAFTQVRGSWVVPSIDCAVNPNGAASFWVGIDGWDNGTVEQTGTESQCNGVEPVAYAWYEFAPKAGVTIRSIRVSPGEDMEAEVRYKEGRFVVTIADLTMGTYFRTNAAVPRAKRASAEWIAESNGFSGLPDFDAVRFGKDFTRAGDTNSATDATTSGPIRAFGKRVQVSILGHDDVDEAIPSFMSFDGSSFSVTYWNP
jgi:hypothetical protein